MAENSRIEWTNNTFQPMARLFRRPRGMRELLRVEGLQAVPQESRRLGEGRNSRRRF